MKRFAVLFAVVLSSVSVFASLDKDRCPTCGKITMRGTDHVCRTKKKNSSSVGFVARKNDIKEESVKSKNKYNNYIQKQEPKNQSIKKNDLPNLYYSASSYNVIGVVIIPNKDDPHLLCEEIGYRSNHKTKVVLPISYRAVGEYYRENIAKIPVLGIKGDKEQREDETLIAAVNKLKKDKEDAAIEDAKEKIRVKTNTATFKTPLKCLTTESNKINITKFKREWEHSEGKNLNGIWVADYEAYNIKGIVLLNVENNQLNKVPLSNLSNEDNEYIKNNTIAHFPFIQIPYMPGSKIGKAYSMIDAKKSNGKISCVAFGVNKKIDCIHYDKDDELIIYAHLFPDGQICEVPINDTYTERSSWVELYLGDIINALPVITIDDAKKGIAYQIEARYANKENEPIIKEYKALKSMMYEAINKIARTDPARFCVIHKWEERFAPKYYGDYQTDDTKTQYAQNLINAKQAEKDGILKCRCNDKYYVKQHKAAEEEFDTLKRKIDKLKEEHPNIKLDEL